MSPNHLDDHVLPRPVEPLPEYAHAKARRTLAERLVEAFGMSEQAANAIADAVVDPSSVRKSIGEPFDPQVEEIAVPGGTVLGIRTIAWTRRIMPDPRNPRIGPSRRHPFAIDPGTGGEESRFRPVPEPQSPSEKPSTVPELITEIESRHHLEWASAQATKFVLGENDWRSSVASQGVMEAVWLVANTFVHGDGAAPATVLTTVEGSSRATALHDLLGIRSADVPYDDYEQRLRLHYRKLNEAFSRGPNAKELVALRCERAPALILVGFRRHQDVTTGFPTAVKSLVALRHVDPPKPWGEGPENEALADEVLDELFRRGLLSDAERLYLAAAITKAEAESAHLSPDPVQRLSRIVRIFTTDDVAINEAIRVAVTSQSTRKRITPKLRNELATALATRSLSGDSAKTDQVRRYLRHAFGKAVHRERWMSTGQPTKALVDGARTELVRSIRDESVREPGPASLELAVRAAYALVVSGGLNADRGTAANDQPDRRTPGEVLDAMRRNPHGVYQLGQALSDFAEGRPIRAVDDEGRVIDRKDGSGAQLINDVYLRTEFPPAGKIRARSGGEAPAEKLRNALATFSTVVDLLETAFESVHGVVGNDGNPLVDADGADHESCAAWRRQLGVMSDELNIWGRTFRRRHGAPPSASVRDEFDASEEGDDSLARTDQAYASSYEGWDIDRSVAISKPPGDAS
jgi:hypothetical protein